MNTNSNLRRAARTLATRPARAAGFTLIEMMISITIGLGILAGLVGVLATNSSNSRANERTSELLTNGRYALNSMKQELREAGFRGYTWAEPSAPGALVVTGCVGAEAGATAAAFIANIRQGVWGANDANPFSGVGNCIPDASYSAGNDVLVVRRLAVIPSTALAAGTVYFHSSYEQGQVFQGVTAPTFGGPPTPLASFAMQIYVYYISPFTQSATESPLVPALYRVALRPDGTMQRELVASGIERLQVQYGQLTTAPATQYLDTLAGDSSAAGATDWEQVNSVRIWLLARNATPEPGYVPLPVPAMGSVAGYTPPSDGFRRQLFTTVVQLRN